MLFPPQHPFCLFRSHEPYIPLAFQIHLTLQLWELGDQQFLRRGLLHSSRRHDEERLVTYWECRFGGSET